MTDKDVVSITMTLLSDGTVAYFLDSAHTVSRIMTEPTADAKRARFFTLNHT
jgi:hypothetical protein